MKPTLDFLGEGGVFEVSLDGCAPVKVDFNSRLNEKPENIYSVYYPTVASRAKDNILTLPLDRSRKNHTLTITPLSPGTVFEKIAVDLGGYTPSYLFGKESEKKLISE